MANSTFTAKITGTFVDAFSQSAQVPALTAACPYSAMVESSIDIPAAALANTTYAVDFGSVGTVATGVLIKNLSGQAITIAINGSSDLIDMPPNAVMLFASPSAADTNPIVSCQIGLLDVQVDAGRVGCFVFGDPV